MTHAPQQLDDGWPVSAPEAKGMDGKLLLGLAPQFEAWSDAMLHAALIVRGETLVYERYFEGDDRIWATPLGRVAYRSDMRHDVRSITKSIVSLLFGIATDRGLIRDLDQPAISFFPEYGDLAGNGKERITLRHLLTMSAGLAWNEAIPYSNPANSERKMIDAPDPYRHVLEQPIARPPGTSYTYNGGLTALLAAIVEKVSRCPLDVFAQEALFDPLGIHDVEWLRYRGGAVNAVSGLRMRPRDVAKIGQIVLQRGNRGGKQILSASWIDKSLSPQINGEGLYFYGFQWWLGRSLVRKKEITWAAAFGHGGQRLYVVPSLDLVVVVMAGLYDNPALQSIVGEVVLRRYALAAIIH